MFGFQKKRNTAIDGSAPIGAVRFVVVDTELTGLDEKLDDIVSIGAVRMTGGTVHLGETFYRLVNPGRQLTRESVVVHEIMPSDVAGQPGIGTALSELVAFCGDAVLVGHFVGIDLAFLQRDAKRILGSPLPNPVVDTCSLFDWLRRRRVLPACPSATPAEFKLYEVVKRFGIPVHGAHHALMDAFTTAQLFQRMVPLLQETGTRNLGDLLATGRPFEGGDRHRQGSDFSNF